MYGEAYCAVKMHLANEGSDPLGDIAIRGGNLRSGQEVKEPATVQLLSPGGTTQVRTARCAQGREGGRFGRARPPHWLTVVPCQAKAHIRFGASDTVKLAFDMAGTVHGAALRAPPGEVLRPRTISDEEFESISRALPRLLLLAGEAMLTRRTWLARAAPQSAWRACIRPSVRPSWTSPCRVWRRRVAPCRP